MPAEQTLKLPPLRSAAEVGLCGRARFPGRRSDCHRNSVLAAGEARGPAACGWGVSAYVHLFRGAGNGDSGRSGFGQRNFRTETGRGTFHHAVEIQVSNGAISSITDLSTDRTVLQTEIPAQPIVNMSDEGRIKRRMVKYPDIPPVLVHAVVSVEDKRFFEHSGLDFLRIAKASYVDVREHRKEQGASTISMQLARNLWLDHDKSWKRKVTEALITLHLEHKLTKQQIFEDYCNLVYLGNAGHVQRQRFRRSRRACISTKTSAN